MLAFCGTNPIVYILWHESHCPNPPTTNTTAPYPLLLAYTYPPPQPASSQPASQSHLLWSKNKVFGYLIPITNNRRINQWINRLLMVQGSRLMAHASRLVARGQENMALGLPGLAPLAPIFSWPWALSHEPLTIHNRLINKSAIIYYRH